MGFEWITVWYPGKIKDWEGRHHLFGARLDSKWHFILILCNSVLLLAKEMQCLLNRVVSDNADKAQVPLQMRLDAAIVNYLHDNIGLRLFRPLMGLDYIMLCTSWGIFFIYDVERVKIYVLSRYDEYLTKIKQSTYSNLHNWSKVEVLLDRVGRKINLFEQEYLYV